ncbi:SDR family oxidoreductase [Parahaliea maris]|uniref:SDR family oxidoreductase n=1 Tax=Parahaliea maris TaxID=2716870 RepID=A0A5C9A5E2_9GAMM|nr:SDR family oxidoreductase [Parahaliea maris]TXS96105.1 SDR family oxidoreductase [Parahaliea maris]
MSYIEGKVVLVTGAAGGFGKLVAEKVAALGARVVLSDVNEAQLEIACSGINEAGGEALAVRADVTSTSEMKALIDTAVEKYGAVDVLVNNAGVMPLAFYADHETASTAWDRCIDINFKGVLHGISAVYDQMIKQGSGHIINMSSIYGNYPVKGAAVYGATKAAVNFLSESLRQEAQGRIKVTTVRPTGIPTTGISGGIVNFDAGGGILGDNAVEVGERFGKLFDGSAPDSWSSVDNIEYFILAPELLADQVVYAINQPLGVSIGDITVRASGDMYNV